MNNVVWLLFGALLPTIAIEYGVLRLLGERDGRVLAASVVLNVLTNVPLNLYVLRFGITPWGVLLAETLVVAVEALGYWLLMRRACRSLFYSGLCNAVSFLCGLLFVLLRHLYAI